MSHSSVSGQTIESDVPARLDRLPWSAWHVRIITALGTSWILDGLEVTLVGSLSGILQGKDGLSLSDQAVAAAATTYLAGAVIGALLFGQLTDRLGRRKLFLVTLATYSLATIGTGLSVDAAMFFICRFFTGLGIGGEYAAINSAVDELIPGKVRGTVDLMVNATFWVGATVGSLAAFYLLGGHGISPHWGWRLAFAVGGTLGLAVLLLRLAVPESPRWLMLRGRERESERIVSSVEAKVSKGHGALPPVEGEKLKITPRDYTPWADIFRNMAGENRQRSILGLTLMVGQAFFLQCGVLHFRPRGQEILPGAGRGTAAAIAALRPGQLLRTLGSRLFVRPDRPQAHDHSGVRRSRRPVGGERHRVRFGDVGPARPDHLLLRDFLRGVLGRERRLPDRERDLPPRDPRVRHRRLLFHWHLDRRRWCAIAVWFAHRERLEA